MYIWYKIRNWKDIRYSTGVTGQEIENFTFHDMITFLEYLHFMISNQTKLFKYATWKCWARHATWRAPPPARGAVDWHWRGEWTLVTVSLVICHLATRVRWSFSVFKMSHYIDCLVFRPDRDTDGEMWRSVPGRHLCVRGCVSSRHQSPAAEWRHWGGCHDLVFAPDIIMFCGGGSFNSGIDLHHYSHYTEKAWHRLHIERAQ